jgi:hypothetical protein
MAQSEMGAQKSFITGPIQAWGIHTTVWTRVENGGNISLYSVQLPGESAVVEFRHMYGTVYILENSSVGRVKIGMTINKAVDRLSDINDIWLGRKVTCQICGKRCANVQGRVPRHVVSGIRCLGGETPPLEEDIALVQTHLSKLKAGYGDLTRTEKGSATKIIKTLEKRIELYRSYKRPTEAWQLRISYYTECAEQVELLSHEILTERLDRAAPFGEVFSCSVAAATDGVEQALRHLGLLEDSRKVTHI